MGENVETLRIVYSKSVNPWYNLALEEYILNGMNVGEAVLFLQQNDRTVVIGRNQNAWKECDWESLEKDGGRLARRMSGGGAVYHDMGNLNFTIISTADSADAVRDNRIVTEALAGLGVEVTIRQNDMLIAGRKFSDHTWYKSGHRISHRGTLLVSSDIERLEYYLRPSERNIRSRSVESVPEKVINISEINPGITVQMVREKLEESCEKQFGLSFDRTPYVVHTDSVLDIYDRYASWQWRFGKSPDFDLDISRDFPWGNVELALTLKNGDIKSCEVYTDAMEPSLFGSFKKHLKGCPFITKYMVRAAEESIENADVSHDIAAWLGSVKI